MATAKELIAKYGTDPEFTKEVDGILEDGKITMDEFKTFINAFLRKQSKEARIFFVKRYFYGESISEIAIDCKCGEGKVKSSLFRTRNNLRKAMEKEGMTI